MIEEASAQERKHFVTNIGASNEQKTLKVTEGSAFLCNLGADDGIPDETKKLTAP